MQYNLDPSGALGSTTTGFLGLPSATNLESTSTEATSGQSYWSELRVWQDANQDGVSQAGELRSLDALGISSISLVGAANHGESIDGSAVTNRATYTPGSGSPGDTTGDFITTATGGVKITSTPEGGSTTHHQLRRSECGATKLQPLRRDVERFLVEPASNLIFPSFLYIICTNWGGETPCPVVGVATGRCGLTA